MNRWRRSGAMHDHIEPEDPEDQLAVRACGYVCMCVYGRIYVSLNIHHDAYHYDDNALSAHICKSGGAYQAWHL